ncbi:hypothetical protein U1701_17695 [Sphingomonas sp. PB2P19]|uniref:hypothetical protein n=1 Tax=Sphingomonas rhamnosi TaxID=3096156 RepID=UPI002FCCA2D6
MLAPLYSGVARWETLRALSSRRLRFAMSRLLLSVIVILVVVVGGLFLLAGRATERPQTRVEKAVTLANLS